MMPTNKPGYLREYYERQRLNVIAHLGGCCSCGSTDNLHIHHRARWSGKVGRGRGRMERLKDWKRNIDSLELLCPQCHKERHAEEATYQAINQ